MMKKTILIIALTLATAMVVLAQNTNQKFAHINTSELLQIMPEVSKADKELARVQSEYESVLRTMTLEYQNKVVNFRNGQNTMSEILKETSITEIKELERRIQEFQQKAQTDLQKKQGEIYEPIRKKASNAIAAVAKEKGFSYVFDVSQPISVVYFEGGIDIMDLVKTKLNLK